MPDEALDLHKLAASRLWAAHRFPYLATALFATTVIPSPGLAGDGVAVDERWRLYVDPERARDWSVEDLGALLVHHTGHLVRDHAGRAHTLGIGEASAERWALAADAELNDDLEDAGLVVPGDPVTPERLGYQRGRLAEEYFHLAPGSGDCDGGDGDAGITAPDHGSGAHGQHRDWEQPTAGGLSSHEADLLRAQVADDILRTPQRGQGNIPANWKRWAEALLSPRVDWRRTLAAEVRRGVHSVAGAVDYTYRRRSRRATVSNDVVLPALEKPVPEIAVVCDTSGSMGNRELARVLAEVEGLLASIGLRGRGVTVLAVDAAVHTVRRVSTARQVELVGGGGTDMGRGLEAASALRPRPSVTVVLTDGMTPWPADPPRGMRVVVGMLAPPILGVALPPAPAWARVVRIDDDAA